MPPTPRWGHCKPIPMCRSALIRRHRARSWLATWTSARGGHSIQFSNAGGGDALVNIRHADTRKLANRFYLRSNEQMTIEGVPDGIYLVQYAFGPALAVDCKTFTRIIRARELPDADELKTQTIDDEDKTETHFESVSYEISVSARGNVKPVNIDAAAFNAE